MTVTIAPTNTGAFCRLVAPIATVTTAATISSTRRSGGESVASTRTRVGRKPATSAGP